VPSHTSVSPPEKTQIEVWVVVLSGLDRSTHVGEQFADLLFAVGETHFG
jgi:hypothetical protein